jgi:hypothetical protein
LNPLRKWSDDFAGLHFVPHGCRWFTFEERYRGMPEKEGIVSWVAYTDLHVAKIGTWAGGINASEDGT